MRVDTFPKCRTFTATRPRCSQVEAFRGGSPAFWVGIRELRSANECTVIARELLDRHASLPVDPTTASASQRKDVNGKRPRTNRLRPGTFGARSRSVRRRPSTSRPRGSSHSAGGPSRTGRCCRHIPKMQEIHHDNAPLDGSDDTSWRISFVLGGHAPRRPAALPRCHRQDRSNPGTPLTRRPDATSTIIVVIDVDCGLLE